jgi:hypothetical protein
MKLSQHVARTGLAAGLAITAASAVAFAAPASAQAAPPKPHKPAVTPMHAYCLDPAPANYDTVIGHTTGSNVNIRVGSGTNCASVGQAQTSHSLDYYCYTWGLDGYSWTYVKDLTTAKRGWIRDDLLSGNGSYDWCGF